MAGTAVNASSRRTIGDLRLQDGIVLIVTSVIGIMANAFACVVSGKLLKKQPLSPNLFVLAMSCINLAALLVSCFPSWLCFFFGRWIGGKTLCEFQGVMILFASISAGALAALMSTDRCVAVVKPLYHRQSMTLARGKILIIIVSLSSLALSSLPLTGFGSFELSLSGTFCSVNSFAETPLERAFVLFYAVLGCLLAVVTVLSNIVVVFTLVKQKRHRINVLQPRVLAARRKEKEEIDSQFAKMMVVISTIFLISWLPYVVRLIGSTFYGWRNESADLIVCRMLLLSLMLDPFTYVLTRKHYRGLIKDMFVCICPRKQVTPKEQLSSVSASNMTTRNNSADESSIPLDQMQYDRAAYVIPQMNIIPPQDYRNELSPLSRQPWLKSTQASDMRVIRLSSVDPFS